MPHKAFSIARINCYQFKLLVGHDNIVRKVGDIEFQEVVIVIVAVVVVVVVVVMMVVVNFRGYATCRC